MIERKITAALQVDTAHVRLPNGLLDKIKFEAAQPQKHSWWAAWTKRRWVQVAAVALLALPLAGFAAKQIWVVPANYPPGAQPASRPTEDMALVDISATVDFKVKLPTYLPEGVTFFASVLAGDSTTADANLRVVEVAYVKDGIGPISVGQWRADTASAWPPGHPFPEVLDTEPWHKTLTTGRVDINGIDAGSISYLISGMTINRVYWHDNGVNYAVEASSRLPMRELLMVARSLSEQP